MSQYQTVNPALLGLAFQTVSKFEKRGFVPGGDPAAAGGDPAAMGGDPAAMGGAPADPSMGGGAPPAAPPGGTDPTAGLGAPAPDLTAMIQQQVQTALGGMQGAGGQIKPKIDESVVLLQVLKILAKISDTLGVQIPASDMVVTPQDLQQMAQGGPGYAAQTPDNGPAAGGGQGAIQPIQPMGGVAPGPEKTGEARQEGISYDAGRIGDMGNRASTILQIWGKK